MKFSRTFIFILYAISLTGCRTTSGSINQPQAQNDAQQAIVSVAGVLSGKELNEKNVRNLNNRMKNDSETKSAVQTLTNTIGNKSIYVKYCPIDGKRYDGHLNFCPEHNVELKTVGE